MTGGFGKSFDEIKSCPEEHQGGSNEESKSWIESILIFEVWNPSS